MAAWMASEVVVYWDTKWEFEWVCDWVGLWVLS